MNDLRGSFRTSAAKAGWVMSLLFFGWLIFVLVPLPPEQAEIRTIGIAQVDSKLSIVGLADNVDWYGLPDYFAVWADQAYWHNDKAKFAYWHAGSRSYDYFFEVTRENGAYRFRSITVNEALGVQYHTLVRDYLDRTMTSDHGQQEESPDSDFPNHPFVFLPLLASSGSFPGRFPLELPKKEKQPEGLSVPIKLEVAPFQIPKGIYLPQLDEQSKKRQ